MDRTWTNDPYYAKDADDTVVRRALQPYVMPELLRPMHGRSTSDALSSEAGASARLGRRRASGPVTLIWATPRNREQHFVRDLLGDMVGEELFQPGFDRVVPGSIYVVNSNRLPLRALPRSFLAQVEQAGDVGILHLGDEWYGGDYDKYRHFAFAMKTHHPSRFKTRALLTLPIGWTDSTPHPDVMRPAPQRTHLWCFMGKLISSRREVVEAFADLDRGYLHGYRGAFDAGDALTPEHYHALLSDTVFVPCPMGNVMLETHRFYEALEAGAIPLVEDRLLITYYDELLGPNPVPRFRSWAHARAFVEAMSRQPDRMAALQLEVAAWWAGCKQELRASTRDFVARGLAGELRQSTAEWASFKGGLRHRVDQWVELAKHHSFSAGLRRARLMTRRALGLERPSKRRLARLRRDG